MPIDELKEERGGCRDIHMTLEVDWILIDEGVAKPKDGSEVKTNSTLVATQKCDKMADLPGWATVSQ